MLATIPAVTSVSGPAAGCNEEFFECISVLTCRMGTSGGALPLPRRWMGTWAARWACRPSSISDDERVEPWTRRAQERSTTTKKRG